MTEVYDNDGQPNEYKVFRYHLDGEAFGDWDDAREYIHSLDLDTRGQPRHVQFNPRAMTYQEKIDNMVEHLKGFGSFQQMARFVLSLQDEDCPRCGGEGFVYTGHYADPNSTTRPCECQGERDPDEKYEQQNDK